MMSSFPLSIRDLDVEISTRRGLVRAVQGVSLQLGEGESLGLVGESGSGKTITLRAVLGLLPKGARIKRGSIIYGGRDLNCLSMRALRDVRGSGIAMIFQEPMMALNPVTQVGAQINEAIMAHGVRDKRAVRRRTLELLDLVRMQDPPRIAHYYPHQLSGGMCQRVMIAMALAGEPSVLLCDEPTTALDVTIQAQIVSLLHELRQSLGLALIYVTHDLALAAQICDSVAVMYAGRVVEEGPLMEVFREPRHAYTLSLLRALPGADDDQEVLAGIPGIPPDLLAAIPGCPFEPRCFLAESACRRGDMQLSPIMPGRQTACIRHAACASAVSRKE